MKTYSLLAQCKPVLTFVAATMIYTSSANAYQTVTDKALFQSLFQDPTRLIDFTHLKDGSIFGGEDTLLSNPLVIYFTTENGGYFEVREEAWSNDVYIGSAQLNCGCGHSATAWNGSYVSPSFYDRLYILNPSNTSPAFPVALNTSAGFIGFIPDNAVDSYYLLDSGVTISSVQHGFSAVPVPEPETYAMLLAGLGVLGFVVHLRKSHIARYQA